MPWSDSIGPRCVNGFQAVLKGKMARRRSKSPEYRSPACPTRLKLVVRRPVGVRVPPSAPSQ